MAYWNSWENELQHHVSVDDLVSVKAILSRDGVRSDGDLGRKEWTGMHACSLHQAASHGRIKMIQLLVNAGFDVNSYWVLDEDDPSHRMTSLHHVAGWDEKRGAAAAETVKLLLDLGADPHLQGEWLRSGYALGTPLEWARQTGGREDVVRILEAHAGKPPKPASLASFEALNPVAKYKQKSAKIQELEEAKRIYIAITKKRVQRNVLKEEVSKDEEKLRIGKAMLKTMDKDLKMLEGQPGFLYMDDLRRHLREIETIGNAFKEALKQEDMKATCPVCVLFPRQVFTCQECDNWVCQDCRGKVVTCPTCRKSLTVKPLRRNKGMERLMGIP